MVILVCETSRSGYFCVQLFIGLDVSIYKRTRFLFLHLTCLWGDMADKVPTRVYRKLNVSVELSTSTRLLMGTKPWDKGCFIWPRVPGIERL
jgi:hypothetical protein